MRILVTGAAGFIGSHLAAKLSKRAENQVLAIDNFAPYYSTSLKRRRVEQLLHPSIEFQNVNISEKDKLREVIANFLPEQIYHLAAQPGIRIPVQDHDLYINSNLVGFGNILSLSHEYGISEFIYASSSSVYGNVSQQKLSESITTLRPTSFYGATKLANEVLARSYSDRYGLKTRGLRFFTVYGPWGRPDMAYFRIASALVTNGNFRLFGDGSIRRDFTFIDDVVAFTEEVGMELASRPAGYSDVVNLGGGSPISIRDVISLMGNLLGHELNYRIENSDPSDVGITDSDSTYMISLIGDKRFTPFTEGLRRVVEWAVHEVSLDDLQTWTQN